jgi:hypothetical protein
LAVAGAAPAIQVSGAVKPAAASLALSSAPPTLSFGANRVPASAVLALVAAPPVARRDIILRAATGSLLLSSDAPSVVRASSAEHKWLVCTSISINPEIGGEASIAAELQGLVEINATLAGKPNVKEC